MAGHSKWANIQHRKKAQDAKRGKIFTRLIREVTIAARMGGGDPLANPRLRSAVDAAKSANMPNDTIERAIKRGDGQLDGDDVNEMTYEGYGPHGVAILVECITDNKNRTVAEVRHAFSKRGGNLGTEGSVSYLFNKQGQLFIDKDQDEERVIECALEAGCDDTARCPEGHYLVSCAPEILPDVKAVFMQANCSVLDAQVTMQATTQVTVDDEAALQVMGLLEMLDNLDDVQNVFSNAVFSEAFLNHYSS